MSKSNEHVTRARGLRADIMAAPDVWLPRRDVLVEWLDGFLRRSEARAFAPSETEAMDLVALEQFLRRKKVPVSG